MPIKSADLKTAEVVEQPLVWVQVREEGHGKISTGEHFARGGEEVYAEGEEFEIAADIAQELKKRYYVDILKGPTPKKAAL